MTCPPESNKGLPLILQGPLTPTILNSIKTPSLIELKSAARTTFPSFDSGFIFNESGATTIRLNGETFSLAHLQIFRSFHGTTYFDPRISIGELTAWFRSSKGGILLASVPIYKTTTNNAGGSYLEAALTKNTDWRGSIGDIFGNRSIHYETCVQYGVAISSIQGLRISVLVFLDGLHIDAPTNTKFMQEGGGTLASFGFPATLLPTDSKTVQIPPAQFDETINHIRRVYSTLISTGTDNFKSRFRYYESTFIQSAQEKKKKEASAYKCIPLDTKKNLKMVNGKLILSLDDNEIENAGTLENIVNQQNQYANEETNISDSATYVALTVGSIAGAALASGLLWLGFRLLVRR